MPKRANYFDSNINKKENDTKKEENADTDEGSKWSLQVYENYCKNNNIDYKYIRKQMGDIAIKSVLSVLEQFLFLLSWGERVFI